MTIVDYSHCACLRDAMLYCPYSYYVRQITVVWLAKTEIESKSFYLQKIESKFQKNDNHNSTSYKCITCGPLWSRDIWHVISEVACGPLRYLVVPVHYIH